MGDFDISVHFHDQRQKILVLLFAGTGCSFLGSLFIFVTFMCTKELHRRRALWHICLKSVSVCTMVIGYWMNLIIKHTDCNDPSFCAVQFVFLQLGNVGIVLSEFAMMLEVLLLTRHFQQNTLAETFASGLPSEIRAAYAFFAVLAVASVGTGLWLYLHSGPNYDKGLACYLDSWCWYLDPWAVFAFKFGWIAVVVCMGASTIVNLVLVSRSLPDSPTLKASKSLASMLRNLLCSHVAAWGTTFVWRVGRALQDPPAWSTSPNSVVVQLVVFNAAGAGYVDVLVWLAFPDIHRKYVLPVRRKLCCCWTWCCAAAGTSSSSFWKGGRAAAAEGQKTDVDVISFPEGDVTSEFEMELRDSSFA